MGRLQHRTSPGFTYFVTTKTWQSCAIFQVPRNADILMDRLLHYRDSGSYSLHEFVVMPNHVHLLLTPSEGTSLEKAVQLIKGGSSHAIHEQSDSKMQIWQAGFHEESVRDLADFQRKLKYIHENPVRAHLVQNAAHWQFGSAARKFQLDGPPERLKICSSGAKAPSFSHSGMSELKLRPPKNLPLPRKMPI
ncbi:MAG TPA: transposase [Candidatus Acidoferrales bacterium]|jgi:putative transposase|nr:transposase [Candidatus Acidoferrales bacterium]